MANFSTTCAPIVTSDTHKLTVFTFSVVLEKQQQMYEHVLVVAFLDRFFKLWKMIPKLFMKTLYLFPGT